MLRIDISKPNIFCFWGGGARHSPLPDYTSMYLQMIKVPESKLVTFLIIEQWESRMNICWGDDQKAFKTFSRNDDNRAASHSVDNNPDDSLQPSRKRSWVVIESLRRTQIGRASCRERV